MASKEDFLNKIAGRLGRERVTQVTKPQWQTDPWDHLHQGKSQEELVQQFEEELGKLGGRVLRIPSVADVPRMVKEWLADNAHIQNVICWQQESLLGQQLPNILQDVPLQNVTMWNQHVVGNADLESQNEIKPQNKERARLIEAAEKADIGFTFASYGISETGSVVLFNRGDQGRLVSLLPTICATFLYTDQIVPRITQVLADMKQSVQDHSCINFITGPSRSADIEMDLSIGVHGPGEIIIFLIDREES